MTLRSPRERLIQTLCYEAGGLVLAGPLYALYAGQGAGHGVLTMAAVSLACLLWAPVHNTAFDWLELRLARRVASDRPHRWRIVHALSHEATSVVLTMPILVWLGGHGWLEALLLDAALTLSYAAYGYVFHLVFDRLRPVRPSPRNPHLDRAQPSARVTPCPTVSPSASTTRTPIWAASSTTPTT